MKSLNLFTRLFTVVVVVTLSSLTLTAYSIKKAYDTDPELPAKIEKRFNIHFTSGSSGISSSFGNSFSKGFYISTSSNKNATQDSWQLPLTQKKIRIKTYSGQVSIKNTSSKEVLISASGELDKEKSPKLLDVNSTANEITIFEPENAVDNLEIHLQIPSSYAQELMIESVSGDVSAENLSPNLLTVETVSGGLIFDSIKSDTLNLNTISGDAHLRNSAITTLSAKSVSGEIEVDNKGSAITRLKSISGDINLHIPDSESHRFDLNSVSGEIKNQRSDNKKAVATIEISTTSGDISVE